MNNKQSKNTTVQPCCTKVNNFINFVTTGILGAYKALLRPCIFGLKKEQDKNGGN